jgi:hypothetical protein
LRLAKLTRHIVRVSAQDAKEAAEKWLAHFRIPENLAGRIVQLVIFASDEDCRFFYPRRALIWQQKVNTKTSRAVRSRKGKVWRVTITPAEYEKWRAEDGRVDSPDLRREFAESFQGLDPLRGDPGHTVS